MSSQLWTEWSRQLDETGVVEFTAGRQVVARVDREGVLLPSRDLLVRWMHLGFADGYEADRFGPMPSTLTLSVSRTWWPEHIAVSTGKERARAEREMVKGWVRVTVSYRSWRRAPVESFGEWLSAEAVSRAPIPSRLYLSPQVETSVFDRDTNRPIPLDRLPISHGLRERIAAWGAAADSVPAAQLADATAWERFLPEGRILATSLQEETGRSAAVWDDCPDVP